MKRKRLWGLLLVTLTVALLGLVVRAGGAARATAFTLSALDVQTVPFAMVQQESQRGGLLARPYFMVLSTPAPGGDIGRVAANAPAHVAYLAELERDGHLLLAGPVGNDDQSWSGVGLYVLRARDRDEARRFCERDPMHTTGARHFEIRPWLLNNLRPDAAP